LSATFTADRDPRHPEGYGLFVGGSHLANAQNRYTYFLVRARRQVPGETAASRVDSTAAVDGQTGPITTRS